MSKTGALLLLAVGALFLLTDTTKQRADAIVRNARRDLQPLGKPPVL